MKKSIWIATTIVVVMLVIAILLSGCPKKESITKNDIITTVPVSVTLVQKQKLTNNISLVGTINASNDVNVISEAQGVVKEVYVKVGNNVVAGKVLAQVDDEIPRSNLGTAQINYEKAQKDFERTEDLFQENSIPVSQLDAARLGMKAAENQLDIAKRQLENTKIKTPISGTVNARYVNIGTMVQPGMTVANVVDISMLKVRVNVSESEAFNLKTGDKIEITTDVYPDKIFEGHIDNIASKSDEAHTYPVEIILPNNSEHPLKAGMFARIAFTSIEALDALTIPRMALIGSIKNAQVFQIQTRVAYLRNIVIGKQSNKYLEVLDGLSLGDTVVTNGQNNLVENARVNIVGTLQMN
jgi:RND family efflux transporter MFP subunit